MDNKRFSAQAGGFHLTFDNGFTLSVQFKAANYSDNYNKRIYPGDELEFESNTAETAIFTPAGEFLPYKGDQVQAYQSFSEFLEIFDFVRNLP